jgi:hypothetical protein
MSRGPVDPRAQAELGNEEETLMRKQKETKAAEARSDYLYLFASFAPFCSNPL